MTKKITLDLGSELEERLRKYLYETYGPLEIHGKITSVLRDAVDCYLKGKGY